MSHYGAETERIISDRQLTLYQALSVKSGKPINDFDKSGLPKSGNLHPPYREVRIDEETIRWTSGTGLCEMVTDNVN